jgi:hypothetical protein
MTKLQREQVRQQTITKERKRIMIAMLPAFDDFNKAGQGMIQSKIFTETGTKIIENVGYMKSVLMDIPKYKEEV